MSYRNRKKSTIVCVIVLIIVFCTMFSIVQNTSSLPCPAFAVDSIYSNVLDDLKKDSTFDVKNYPVVENDYSLKIIQLAESVDKELFVYVYQPCGKSEMRASSINLSTTSYVDIMPDNYNLKYINSNGVFFKYVVDRITVSDAEARYYGVTSIFRPFNKDYGDKEAGGGNTVSEVSFSVSKEYRFFTINGNLVTATLDIKTIQITDKFVGFVRYDTSAMNFLSWVDKDSCDSHFVAFNTDKPIDKLVEATVSWKQQDCFYTKGGTSGERLDKKDIISDSRIINEKDSTVECKRTDFYSATYTWKRIESVDEFIKNTEVTTRLYSGAFIGLEQEKKLSQDDLDSLKNKQWVLRFAETDYSYRVTDEYLGTTLVAKNVVYENKTLVSDVTILRLKFITDGVTYNLGVVDNKQTGSSEPVGDDTTNVVPGAIIEFIKELIEKGKDGLSTFMIILIAIIGILLLVFLICALPSKKSANKIVIENTDNKTTKKYKKKSKK